MQKTLIIAVILSMNFVMVKSKSAKAKNEGKPSRQPLKRLVNGAVQNPDDEATKRQRQICSTFEASKCLTRSMAQAKQSSSRDTSAEVNLPNLSDFAKQDSHSDCIIGGKIQHNAEHERSIDVSDIADSMYGHLLEKENDFFTNSDLLSDDAFKQRRAIIDWLVTVHRDQGFKAQTLWICINLIDRYLKKNNVDNNMFQLLGIVCLLVASKYEEVNPLKVEQAEALTHKLYACNRILEMEQDMLQMLDYQICAPTGFSFLTQFLDVIEADMKTKYFAFYYAELNLQESVSLQYKPSHFVCAALYAALVKAKGWVEPLWPESLVEETGFTEQELIPHARVVLSNVDKVAKTSYGLPLTAIRDKYSQDKFLKVAMSDVPHL